MKLHMRHYWIMFMVTFLAMNMFASGSTQDRVNLALRKTVDMLLRISGDSTSRIPAINQVNEFAWKVEIRQRFIYDSLPPLLQNSLDQYGIRSGYQVAIRRCDDGTIDLGYHQQDLLAGGDVPCLTREEPAGCHYLEVTFDQAMAGDRTGAGLNPLLLIILVAGAGVVWWISRRRRSAPVNNQARDDEWLPFGRSRLHVNGHIVECDGVREQLTYREAKLLRLFVLHAGELLERDQILKDVWEDEGIQVGRSVDMFVSRLRKKLKSDPTISIAAVHGVGYRMLMQEV